MDAPTEPADAELVAQAQKGSQAAFRKLVEKYQRRLYAMALGMMKDPDEARDAVQDALLKAYRNLPSFQGQSAFYTWLYRIGVNVCIDRMRSQGRVGKVEYEEGVDAEDDGESGISPRRVGFDPAQALHSREIRERLERAIAELSPTHRAVLLLREVDGLSYKEIAEVMECSEGTVMSRLFHARKNMQARLRPLVDGDPGQPSAEASPAPPAAAADHDGSDHQARPATPAGRAR